MRIEFGTDGWRGLLGKELTNTNVARVADAFSKYIKKHFRKEAKRGIAIGYDGRNKSKEFAQIFSSVLAHNQIPPVLSDSVIPTPCLSYYVYAHGMPAGVMITASHNPPVYNGIKFKMGYGGPFSTEQTKEIESLIDYSFKYTLKKREMAKDLLTGYKNHISERINFSLIREMGIYPVIESMGGSGKSIIAEILSDNGIMSVTLHCDSDTQFYGMQPEPIEKNLTPLAAFLRSEKGFTAGLATDGDADRLGVLDERGKWFSAQHTILAFADYLKNFERENGALVKTSSVTSKLYRLQTKQTRVHEVQVGFKYICEKMIETKAVFGAEESGGYGFRRHIPERDGIFSALLFLECLAARKMRKASMLRSFLDRTYGKIHYDRNDVHYPMNDRLTKLPSFAASLPKKIGRYEILHPEFFQSSRGVINGVKLFLGDISRWVLIRASETEPLFRIYCEGNTGKEVGHILKTALKIIHN